MCILICTLVVTNENAISYINIHPTHKKNTHVDLYDKLLTNYDGKLYKNVNRNRRNKQI